MRTQTTPLSDPLLPATEESPPAHELLDRVVHDPPTCPATDDPLAFTPVPSAFARHDGWTPERQRAFIDALATLGVVAAAARAVGMSRKSAYALLKRAGAEGEFARAWAAAVETGGARALDLAIGRAIDGTTKPVFYRGRQVGEVRRYNDALLLAALRAVARREGGTPPDVGDEPWLGSSL